MKIKSFQIHDASAGHLAHFEAGLFLKAEATPAVATRAILCSVCETKPGAAFDFLDARPGVTPFLPLIGRRFTGMDANVLTFGSIGARISLDGVQWVRDAGAL